MLTPDQRKQLASFINVYIDIPLVPEAIEQVILEHALSLIDSVLDELIPASLRDFACNADLGIASEMAGGFAERLKQCIVDKVNIPYLDESQEKVLIGLVVDTVVKAMKTARSLASITSVSVGL